MPAESELVELLHAIADHAPATASTRDRLSSPAAPVTPRRRWLPVVAAVTAVTVAAAVPLAAREVDTHHAAAAGGLGATAPTTDRATYRLPLDAYYASATQERTLQRAQFVLARRCARDRGVVVPMARIPAGDERSAFLETVANDVRPLTFRQARTIGYDLYPSGTSAVDAALAGLSPEQREIFAGWGSGLNLPKPTDRFLLEGGCDGQATRTLLKDARPAPIPGQRTGDGGPGLFDDDMTVVNLYVNEARTGETSPAVRQAQQRWSACMATRGYPGLHTTMRTIERMSAPRSTAARREAVQDVTCKQSTGFMTVWVASVTRAQQSVIAAHHSALTRFKRRLATRLHNAATALK